MPNLANTLKETLAAFDIKTIAFSELDVSQAIRALRDTEDKSEPPMQWLAEVMAFDFCENYQNQVNDWGTYYGPMMVLKNRDGTFMVSPSIKRVTVEMVQYWTERAAVARHPVIRARYADLVWDFSKIIVGTSAPYNIGWTAIDSIIEIAKKNCHKYEVQVITKLERALSLALALNDTARIEAVLGAVVSYEDHIAQDSKPGLWGFAYDLLLERNKIAMPERLTRKLIDDLESRLKRVAKPENPADTDAWAADAAALRLASYYRARGRAKEMRRVLMEFGFAFEQTSVNASALQASAWLQHVHDVYVEYGLNAEAEGIAIKLQQVGTRMAAEMKQFSYTMEISREKMANYVAQLTAGNVEQVFSRLSSHYIPKKSQVENQLKELASKHPVSFLFFTKLQDSCGRPVATVGPLRADLSGNIVKQMSQNMTISSLFMRAVFSSLPARFPTCEDSMVAHVHRSPIFDHSRRTLVEMGVKAYFRGDYTVAVHILIPQIEEAIRTLLRKIGGSILRPVRGGGLRLKILDELLREPMIEDVFGKDSVFYMRVLLTDQRGMEPEE